MFMCGMAVRRTARRWLPAATGLVVLALAGPATAAPPPAPSGLTVSPAGPTQASSVTATWVVPADLPTDTTAHVQLCPVDDIAPTPGVDRCENRPSDELTRTTIPFPSEGGYDLTVSLENAEGQGPSTAPRRIVIDRTAPAAPTNVRWDGGTVRWTELLPMGPTAPIVRAHWAYCRGWSGVPTTCVSGSAGPQPFPFSEDVVPLGPPPGYCVGYAWTFSLWLEDAAGNVDASRRGGRGGGVTPSCPAQNLPPGTQPKEMPPGTQPTNRRATSVAVRSRVGVRGGRSTKRRVKITASVRPADVGGRVRLKVAGRRGATKLSRTRSLRLVRGRVTLTVSVPRGFRRLTVRAAYAGSRTHRGSTGKAVVRIPRR